jgi:hypothetical protein
MNDGAEEIRRLESRIKYRHVFMKKTEKPPLTDEHPLTDEQKFSELLNELRSYVEKGVRQPNGWLYVNEKDYLSVTLFKWKA